MDNFNTKLENLKKDLITLINNSEMPVGVVYYLLKDISSEVESSYKQTLALEQQVQLLNDSVEEDDRK